MTYTKFGDKPKVEPVWIGPLDIKREVTDRRYLIALGAYIAIWIPVAIYAFCTGDSLEAYYTNAFLHLEVFDTWHFLSHNINSVRYIVLAFSLLSLVVLVIFIALFRWATKALVCIAMFLFTGLLIVLYGLFIYAMIVGLISYVILVPLIIFVVIYVMLMCAFAKTGLTAVCKVIKESCKAMFFFPSTSFFMFAQFLLQTFLLSFFGAVYVYLKTIRLSDEILETITENLNHTSNKSLDYSSTETNSSDDWYDYPDYITNASVPFYIYIFHAINCIGFLWTSTFIMGFTRMVLTATFATWYHVKDKNIVPLSTLPKCTGMIARYHLGTIAFASSAAALVPMACIVYKHSREKLKEIFKQPIALLSWHIMLTKFAFDALSMSAIHGKTFYKAAKESYILNMKNPTSFLAINTVSECVVFLGSLIVPATSLLSVIIFCAYSHEKRIESVAAIFSVTLISLLMSLTFFMVFRAASNTIRYCYLEDSKFNNEAEMNLYEIQKDDDIDKDLEP